MTGPTPFIEANALLAMQEGDRGEAYRLVTQLLPAERAGLAEACDRLARQCRIAGAAGGPGPRQLRAAAPL